MSSRITNYEGSADPTPPTAGRTATKAIVHLVLARVHETKGLELEQMTGEVPVPAALALASDLGH